MTNVRLLLMMSRNIGLKRITYTQEKKNAALSLEKEQVRKIQFPLDRIRDKSFRDGH